MKLLSALHLPHWLMLAGAFLLVVGFLGLAFRKNRELQQPAARPTPTPLGGRAVDRQAYRPASRSPSA
jgi:LPXTG-motif cell wall-anchored protein